MSDVRVTIGANSAQLESEFDKVQASAGRLKKSIGDAGGVLEGDRRVENKLTAFVEGFKSAQNGADLLANTMGNLGDVFKSSLAVGVGLNVGAALVGMIGSAIAAADELKKSAKAVGDELRAAFESGDSGRLESSIKKANDEIEKLRKSYNSVFGRGAARTGIAEISAEKTKAGKELVELARQELEIQKLIEAKEWDKADAMQEELRYKKEAALIKDLNLDGDQYNERIDILKEASDARLKAKRKERSDEREKTSDNPQQDQHVKDFERNLKEQKRLSDEATKANTELAHATEEVAKAYEQVEEFMMDDAELLAAAEARRDEAQKIANFMADGIEKQRELAKVQKEELQILRLKNSENEKAVRIENEAIAKKQKAIDDGDKAQLEAKREWLKEQQNIVKKGNQEEEQEQKKRDDKAMQALQGGGGLQALQAQRLSDRQAEAAKEKAAGILARDEVRRAAGGDAMKMSAKDIADVKARILGEKQLDKKKIEDAIDNIPKIEREIARLVAKLGVK